MERLVQERRAPSTVVKYLHTLCIRSLALSGDKKYARLHVCHILFTLRANESLSEENTCAKVVVTPPVAETFSTTLDLAGRSRTTGRRVERQAQFSSDMDIRMATKNTFARKRKNSVLHV